MLLSAMSHAKRSQFLRSRNEADGGSPFEDRAAFAEAARLRILRRQLKAGDSDGFCSNLRETVTRLQSPGSAFSAEMTANLLSGSILLLLEDSRNQGRNLEWALMLFAKFRTTSREPVTAIYFLATELARREMTGLASIGVYREFLACSGAAVHTVPRRLVEAALTHAIEQTDSDKAKDACVEQV